MKKYSMATIFHSFLRYRFGLCVRQTFRNIKKGKSQYGQILALKENDKK